MPRASIRLALLSIGLSGVAVAASLLQLPSPLRRLAEQVASPGEFLWWATLGGAFAGRPTGFVGYAVWLLGTAAFWYIVLGTLSAVVRRLRGRP